MPPRGPGRGIVKSGNAGNSTKASPPVSASGGSEKDKPLFPLGSKYPLSLLNERCQKNGWEKPEVNTRHHPNGYSFVVTLRRHNRKTSQMDSVQLDPHPPYIMPTALEARHWGATYALYRVCNNIQLNRVLPPGPRDYWSQLEQEHRAAPEHMKWMYDPDPFAARKEVDARQEKATKRREEANRVVERGEVLNGADFTGAVEVKMSGALREIVENAIKQAHESRARSAEISPAASLPEALHASLTESLTHLSFTPSQVARTLKALGTPSPLTTSLLSSSANPLQAAISHLLLCVPESDLPPRFLARDGGEAFIHSTHKGTEDLRNRWLLERAVKEAGYPEPIVRNVFSVASTKALEPTLVAWDTLMFRLGRKLVGEAATLPTLTTDCDIEERDSLRVSEIAALESVYPSVTIADDTTQTTDDGKAGPATYLVIPIANTPLTLHMVLPGWHPYPLSTEPPPMYISTGGKPMSQSVVTNAPPYVRLHILSIVLGSSAVRDRAPGEGIGLVAAGIVEDEWERVQRQGPPDVADVMRHLVDARANSMAPAATIPHGAESPAAHSGSASKMTGRRREAGRAADSRSDTQILAEFERMKAGEQYLSLLEGRRNLPAWNARADFLQAFDRNRVVVCVGETGSGKTTQVPQFIFDEYLAAATGKPALTGPHVPSLAQLQIVITQPRRVAAMSVAARVAAERGEDGSVGYTIRGESNATWRTKLLFCTTGVVLRRLGTGNGLDDVNVIVVDEVHERSVDGDFLLLELRELLRRNKTLRVVLMSATINHETFVNYFGGAALVTIPGRTFPVKELYLEDIIPIVRYSPPFSKPAQKQSEEKLREFRQKYSLLGMDADSIRALEIVTRAGRIDYQLVAAVAASIINRTESGAILVFMPGVQEIKQCIDAIKSGALHGPTVILSLHANLSSEEQKLVFKRTPQRKIIVATNVAETSITIDEVVYVIDAGKVKETSYDPETGLSHLAETWVTQAAARQRKGRAGRTRPGECYKLYTRAQEMEPFPVPEMLRVPLESLSLAVKAVREEEDVKLFLAKAIDPPKVVAMERAWLVLQELGAVDGEGKLTALGRYMSLLPVDLRLGKMLVLAAVFDCLEPVLTVAACLSSKPLFVSPMEKREEATRARARFACENSDLLTDARAYDECMGVLATGKMQALRYFCDANFISLTTVQEITVLREDFVSALVCAGFEVRRVGGGGHPGLLKGIITAGLYPHVARVTLPASAVKFDKVQAGAVQREQEAGTYRLFDLDGDAGGARVFIHPGSVLFGETRWREGFVCYLRKVATTKVFVREVTEVPIYALLLFGGAVAVDHVKGGVAVELGRPRGRVLRLRAWPRIGVLVNELRRLLDAQLDAELERKSLAGEGWGEGVRGAMMALLTGTA